MSFEKNLIIGNNSIKSGWTACSNCGYKDKAPSSADYQARSSLTASEKNAANNGKSCVS